MAVKDKYDMALESQDEGSFHPTKEEASLLKYLENKFESSKNARQHKISRWRRNEELYNGDFFAPFNLPKYKSRIVANTVHSTVETIYSILTDRNPKVDIMPKTEQQVDSAKQAQELVEATLDKEKCWKQIQMMKKDGLIYGNGYVKTCYVDGKVEYIVPDVYTVFFDPLATSVNDAKCVIFATPTYISDIEENFENGKYVKAEGSLNEYKSFVKKSNVSETQDKQIAESKSPADSNDGKGGNDYGKGQALLKEAWYYDGDDLCIATWCGKVLLQKEKAPYKQLPIAVFQNYQDAHTIYGKGEPEIIESLAVGTAILLSQGIDNIILHGNPQLVMSKSLTKIPGNRPSDRPGKIFYKNNPSEQIDRIPAGNISSSTLPMAETLIKMTDTVSGVHDITQGRNPSGVTASRAIAQLQEASQQIIRAKEREIGSDAVVDIYKQTLEILQYNYESPITIRTFSESGSGYEFDTINPYDVDSDMDFKYVPGSSMPESRAARFDQALDLLQVGLIDQEKFWRWTQKDISKEILNEILEQKQMQQEQMRRDMEILQNSTDEDEILDAKMRVREGMGFGQQPTE